MVWSEQCRMWKQRTWTGLVVASLSVAVAPASASGQNIEVPADLQFTLLAKTLTFDRNLKGRVGAELVIGVVYQPGFIVSRDFARAFEAAWRASPIASISGIPVRYEAVELVDIEQLAGTLVGRGIDVAVLAPLRAVPMNRVLEATTIARALTAAAVADQVDDGVVLGIALRGGKPRIRINLASAKLAHCDFDANLLKLAEVVR